MALRLFITTRTPAFVIGLAVCLGSEASAQDLSQSGAFSGVPEEEFFEFIDDEETSANVAEMLSWLHENPIDLNSAERDDLLIIPGVRSEDAEVILRTRESEGEFASVDDIRLLPGGEELLAQIRPYVVVHRRDHGTSTGRGPAIALSSRLSNFFPGTAASPGTEMLGSPARSLSRITVHPSGHLKAGVLFEKDAGERTRDGFVSGYVSFRGSGVVEQVILGDFNADAGQGLVLWRGTDAGRGGDVAGGMRKPGARLFEYHLADEAHYLRGAAIALKSKPSAFHVRCMLLVSRAPLAASVNEHGEVTSFYSSGLYRTATELKKRDTVHEVLAGTRVEGGLRGKGTIGVTLYRSAFDRAVQPGSGFGFSGERSQVAGGDLSIIVGRATLFGEIARTMEGGKAWIAGGVMPLDSAMKVSVMWRDYSRHFSNPHARVYGVQANASNERGISVGWSLRLMPGVAFRGYADQCKIPGSTYASLLPRTVSDFLVELAALPMPGTRLAFALRMRRFEIMQPIPGDQAGSMRVQGDRDKRSVRFTGRMEIASHLEAKTRIEHGESRLSISNRVEKGTLASQTFRYNARGLAWECGVAFFGAESYDARLYEYEGNVRGAVPSPPLYGRGSRWHLLISWGSLPWIRLAAKYAVTEREKSPVARELGVQAEVRF